MDNVHLICGKIVDSVLKFSLKKFTTDNITCILVAFKNFEDAFKDENYEIRHKGVWKCMNMKEEIDLGLVSDKGDKGTTNMEIANRTLLNKESTSRNHLIMPNLSKKNIIVPEEGTKNQNKKYYLLNSSDLK